LETEQSRRYASRFSHSTLASPGFEVLNLAENHDVASREMRVVYGPRDNPIYTPKAITILPIEVRLCHIVDLTEPAQADMIRTSAQELTGDWRSYAVRKPQGPESISPHWGDAPTQRLGAELFHVGKFKGLISFSAPVPDRRILVVFTEHLDGADSLSYEYTDTSGVHRQNRRP